MQHVCQASFSAVNILCNKSGYREVVIQSSSRGYWHNRILVHGATWLVPGRGLHHTSEWRRWINISNPLRVQKLPVENWPEFVCCHNKKETWSAGEFLRNSNHFKYIFYRARLGVGAVCLKMSSLHFFYLVLFHSDLNGHCSYSWLSS